MPLAQEEFESIKTLLYQNGVVMDKGGVIITVNKVCKILELFLNQLKEGDGYQMNSIVMEHERYAGEGEVWICMACGKVSPYDRYGDRKSDHGWDVCCCLNSKLISLETLKQYRERGL